MCGIVGYVGSKAAAPRLVEGLKTLEYRGYDSAGLVVAPEPQAVKALGEIANLEAEALQQEAALQGTAGIAHTRWATHGEPSLQNAHPHTDASGELFLVHNGIVENHDELRASLQERGIHFTSSTDTEVLAKLIGVHYQGDLAAAVRTALSHVRGAYGIVVLHAAHPNELVAARQSSPIVLGVGEDGHFVASDAAALLPYTRRVVYLNDGEAALLTAEDYHVTDGEGLTAQTAEELLSSDAAAVKKAGYPHFMLKEIMEGPAVVTDTLRGRLAQNTAKLGGLDTVAPELRALDALTVTACGSAFYAGEVGSYLLERYAAVPTTAMLASEYRYRPHLVRGHEALVAVSQSGETADTLAAIREANAQHLLTLGVVNVVGAAIARETQAGVYNHAGPEIAVASTKAFISQLVVMVLLTLALGRARTLTAADGAAIVAALEVLPEQIETLLQRADDIQAIAERYASYEHAIFIGRNTHAPIAAEGALKLKEVSYIHAEAYPAGELKHGPLALLGESCPVVALAPHDSVFEKMCTNIAEAKARQAPILAVTTQGEGERTLHTLADDLIVVPETHPAVQPVLSTVPLHLLAYYVGVAKGYNVDRPRNLAKSVTVE